MIPAGVHGLNPGVRWRAGRVVRVEAVHVFFRRYSKKNFVGVDLRRQRQLHQDAIDFRTRIQGADQTQQFVGGYRRGQRNGFVVDAQFPGSFCLAANVDFGCGVVADE